MVPVTALWTNLHAGFVAWLATLGLLLLLCALARDWPGLRRYGVLLSLCSLASLLNPYGWHLHLHIARYLNSSWILEHVQEFQSPQIRSEGMIVFALMLLGAAAVAPRGDRFEALLVMVWGFLALRSARHVPFFVIAAAPVVASGAAAYWAELASRAGRRTPIGIFWELAQEFGRQPRASIWLPVSAVLGMMLAPPAGFPATCFRCARWNGTLQALAPRGRTTAHPHVGPVGRLPDLPAVSATARLLRRPQRLLRRGDRIGLPQAARVREIVARAAGPLPV